MSDDQWRKIQSPGGFLALGVVQLPQFININFSQLFPYNPVNASSISVILLRTPLACYCHSFISLTNIYDALWVADRIAPSRNLRATD